MNSPETVDLLSGPYFWLIVAAISIGNFTMRGIFILLMDRMEISDNLKLLLKYIPASVLAALVVPAILLAQGQIEFAGADTAMSFLNGRECVIAGLAAVAMALWRRSMMLTIVGGMLALYLLQFLFA